MTEQLLLEGRLVAVVSVLAVIVVCLCWLTAGSPLPAELMGDARGSHLPLLASPFLGCLWQLGGLLHCLSPCCTIMGPGQATPKGGVSAVWGAPTAPPNKAPPQRFVPHAWGLQRQFGEGGMRAARVQPGCTLLVAPVLLLLFCAVLKRTLISRGAGARCSFSPALLGRKVTLLAEEGTGISCGVSGAGLGTREL